LAAHDPELTLAVPRSVAAQQRKPIITDDRTVGTETTLAIPWSGSDFFVAAQRHAVLVAPRPPIQSGDANV